MSTFTWNFLNSFLKCKWYVRLFIPSVPPSASKCTYTKMYLFSTTANLCSLKQSLFGDNKKINLKERTQFRQTFSSFSAWWSQPEFLVLKFQLRTDLLEEGTHDCKELLCVCAVGNILLLQTKWQKLLLAPY